MSELIVGGLATDYCVKNTVLDALSLGYRVTVASDCIRAVNVEPGDGDKAVAEMRSAGAQIIDSSKNQSLMLGQLFALLTAFCWAQNSVAYSIAGKRVSSLTVTHIRLWIAMPAIIIVHYFFLGRWLPAVSLTPELAILSASGFVGFFIADVFIFYGFVAIGPGRTLLIMTLSPVLSAAISFFALNEALGLFQIIGMAVTIIGILIVVYFENRNSLKDVHHLKGFIIAVLGAFAQAAAMVMSKLGMADGIHPVSANVIRISSGFAGLSFLR